MYHVVNAAYSSDDVTSSSSLNVLLEVGGFKLNDDDDVCQQSAQALIKRLAQQLFISIS
jgi:hypothetical protein